MGEVARCGGSRWAKLPDVADRDGRSCPMWRLEMGEVARCGPGYAEAPGSRWAKLPVVAARDGRNCPMYSRLCFAYHPCSWPKGAARELEKSEKLDPTEVRTGTDKSGPLRSAAAGSLLGNFENWELSSAALFPCCAVHAAPLARPGPAQTPPVISFQGSRQPSASHDKKGHRVRGTVCSDQDYPNAQVADFTRGVLPQESSPLELSGNYEGGQKKNSGAAGAAKQKRIQKLRPRRHDCPD
eukprot:gene7392-biopygen3046